MSASAAPTPPPSYWARREDIAARAAGIDAPPATIDYTPVEHEVWADVAAKLHPRWNEHAASDVLAARDQLALPADRIPQLAEVTDRLRPLTGFEFCAVEGLIPTDEFFAGLARRRFSSTQYVRWEGSPLYTPEPDVIHELVGHAATLAHPRLAAINRKFGEAAALGDRQLLARIERVYWFTLEFGVCEQASELRAYGAGLLSSIGELQRATARATAGLAFRRWDLEAIASCEYDTSQYQTELFVAPSFAGMLDELEAWLDAEIAAL